MRGARGTLACSRTAFLGSEPTSVVGVECGPIRKVAGEWLLGYPEDGPVVAQFGR